MMDSSLFQVQSLFYQGAYSGCIDLAIASTRSARSSDPETVTTLLYAARSHLALSPSNPAAALALLKSIGSQEPHVQAVTSLAKFLQSRNQDDSDAMLSEIVNLTELLDHAVVGQDSGQVIRCAAATALYLDGDAEEALNTLGVGTATSQELECVALGVHILIAINRLDLAEKEYLAARTWADDSLLIQLIEAWLGLSKGGRNTQQAFYVYDELAQTPSTAGTQNSVASLIGKATALAASNDVEAANKQLDEALRLEPTNAQALANKATLASYGILSLTKPNPAADYLQQLRQANSTHPLLTEYASLESKFDQHAANYHLGSSVEA